MSGGGKPRHPGSERQRPIPAQLRSLNFRQTFHEGVAHGRLSAVAFSPDGRELGVAAGNRLLLWSTTKEFALSFPAQINDIVFDPRNRWIATASSDRLVRILDAKSLRLLKTLSGRSDPILALAVSPDGRLLASGGLDKDVILWDTEAGKRLHRLQGHTDWIRVIAFSPDGQHLASGSDEKTIRIWSADSGKLLNTLKTVSEVEGLSFTPDGRSLASGTDNGILQIWSFACGSAVCLDGDIPAPKSVSMRNVRGESGPFDFSFQNLRRIQQSAGRLALSPDGHWLARGGKDVVEIREMPDLRLSAILGRRIGVTISRFSPDGRYLAFATDQFVHLWDTTLGRPTKTIVAPPAPNSASSSQPVAPQPGGL
jgi:WD40 repeat protein